MKAWSRATCTRRSSPGLGKIGVLVGLKSSGDQAKLTALGRQVAMHVAAASPLAVDAERIDPQTIARERAIFAEQARESGKPEAIIEKMVEGRVRKFYEESTLLKQAFVIDTERTVETVLKDAAKDLGGAGDRHRFRRLPARRGRRSARRKRPERADDRGDCGNLSRAPA